VTRASRCESSLATMRIVEIFAISDGWNAMGPRSIQLLVPAAVPEPVPMISVVPSRTMLTMYPGTATHSIQRGSTRERTVNAVRPMPNHTAWRIQAFSVTGFGMCTAPAE
jgi:hypothetical protein